MTKNASNAIREDIQRRSAEIPEADLKALPIPEEEERADRILEEDLEAQAEAIPNQCQETERENAR